MDFQDDVDNNALDNMDDSEIWRRKYVITEVKYRNICEQKVRIETEEAAMGECKTRLLWYFLPSFRLTTTITAPKS